MNFLQTLIRNTSTSSIGKFCIRNSPKILIGIGVVSLFGTVVSTIFATKRTIDEIEVEQERRKAVKTKAKIDGESVEAEVVDEKMDIFDIAKLSWKHWLLPLGFMSISGASFIFAYRVEHGRGLRLAALLSASEGKLAALEQSVIEEVGEKKAEDIQDKAAQKIINEKKVGSEETKNRITNERKRDCEYLCYDPITEQEFWTTYTKLEYAKMVCDKTLDRKRIDWDRRNYVSINDFITTAGGEYAKGLGDVGWSAENYEAIPVHIRFGCTEHQEPCFELDYGSDKPHWLNL